VLNEAFPGRIWDGDGVEIGLNLLDDKGMPKTGGVGDGQPVPFFGPDDVKMLIGYRAKLNRIDILSPELHLKPEWFSDVKLASQLTDDGYQMEVAIP